MPRHGGREITVLHVDDDSRFLETAAALLERADGGLEVVSATSARDGLDLLAADRDDVDCVVSDYRMPGTNGVAFLRTIREEFPDLPFILFTGEGSEEVASEAITDGATDYLQKGGSRDRYDLLANRIRNAVERYRSARRAADLDRLCSLTSRVNQALNRASSREVIETRVCEILADADPYRFAWIGTVDSDANRIEPRASAGIEAGYLETITVTADESATGRGPTGRAVRTREPAIMQDIPENDEYEPWREDALERGYRSSAAIPLRSDDTLYGVLNVYANRPGAFDANERAALTELADDVGHAIDRVETREQLRNERDRRAALFENTRAPLAELELADRPDRSTIRDVNSSFESAFGRSVEDVTGEPAAGALVPDDERDLDANFLRRASAGEQVETEIRQKTTDGQRTFRLRITPFDAGKKTGSAYAIYHDVTEREARARQLEALHRSTRRLMVADTPTEVASITAETAETTLGYRINVVRLLDETGEHLEPVAVSERASTALGERPVYPVGDGLVGEAFARGQRVVYDDVADLDDGYPRGGARAAVYVPIGEHGVLSIVETTPNAFDDGDRTLASVLAANAEAALSRLERERELREKSTLLDQLFEQIPIHLYVKDDEGRHLRASRQLVDPDEIAGKTDPEYYPSEFADATYPDDMRVIETGEPIVDEEEYVPLAGSWHLTSKVPWYDEDGEIAGLIGVTREITARKEYQRRIERQNQRLEEFASIVSHDLRNPLNVAEGRLELARDDPEGDHLAEVARAHDRMKRLIDDLLTLARDGETVRDVEVVDFGATVADCWRAAGTASATLVTETDRSVWADRDRLRQLLENLFRNAVEHGSSDVTVTIGDFAEGFYVADDGPGIPEDDRETVFERGYSTTADGTGFGLTIVEQVADAHGWEVAVAEDGGGTRFEITGVRFVDSDSAADDGSSTAADNGSNAE